MKKQALLVLGVPGLVLFYLASLSCEEATPAEGKVNLRVLYVGEPDTDREKDFVGFLEKHFAKAGKADLEKVEAKDAEGFDVVIVDYSELTIKGNAIVTPRMPFGRGYSRPILTIGAAGALVCDSLGLKTGYL